MIRWCTFAFSLLIWSHESPRSDGCSTLIAGPLATTDGSVLLSHSNDGDGDGAGNLKQLYPQIHPPNSTRSVSRGTIPQVLRTFGFLREGYAAINEKQVSLGESTCSGVFSGTSNQILNIVDLGEIAMERADSARNAVSIMGSLAQEYGYYDAGESLMVIDPREAWIFHILPDDTGYSAIWVGLRVPDDHIGTVDNAFTIRNMTLNDPSRMLYSKNIPSIAKSHGWWDGDSPLDFTRVFSGPNEATQKYTSGRRMWVVYDTFAPSQPFSAYYENYTTDSPYPPTLKPDFKVNVTAFMSMMRNDYENTTFDLTSGLAAGPFGTPSRWVTPQTVNGQTIAWERPISTFKSFVSYIAQARAWLPNAIGGTLWFAPDASKTSCYVPFYVRQTSLPTAYTNNQQGILGRNESAWWAHRFLYNIVQLHFNLMIQDVQSMQQQSESTSLLLQQRIDREFTQGQLSLNELTELVNWNANKVVRDFWELSDKLVMAYADGYCNSCGHGSSKYLGYPKWWLEAVMAPPNSPKEHHQDIGRLLKRCLKSCQLGKGELYQASCVDSCAEDVHLAS